jgi:hypothetical protein
VIEVVVFGVEGMVNLETLEARGSKIPTGVNRIPKAT